MAGTEPWTVLDTVDEFVPVITIGERPAIVDRGFNLQGEEIDSNEPPRCNRALDNDCDGDPNYSDPNDDCSGCDPNNLPRGNRNDDEDEEDDDNDDVVDDEDTFLSNGDEWSDMDRDGIGDNSDPDRDGDGHFGDDMFPDDPNAHWGADRDGVDDSKDVASNDHNVTGDADHDDIDDRIDLDPTRPGPWIAPDGDEVGDVTPQSEWERPSWARKP